MTGHDGNVFTDDGISTHTPARGVTPRRFPDLVDEIYFYSHAREGRDGSAAESETEAAISTHTPARGVTCR